MLREVDRPGKFVRFLVACKLVLAAHTYLAQPVKRVVVLVAWTCSGSKKVAVDRSGPAE